jgi:serine/threonine-protein kinase
LTGKTPFDGETPVEIAMKHLSTPPKPPSKLRPDVPPELDMVVMRALAKNPDDRYQSADEMEGDLDRVARGARVSATTVDTATQVLRRPAAAAATAAAATAATMIAPPPSAGAVPPMVVEEEEFEEHGGPDRPLWPWLVAVGFVVAAVVAGFFVWHELAGSTPQVTVNRYVGLPQAQAEQQITTAHLVPVTKKGPSPSVPQGKVFNQDPTAGSKVDKGGPVTIFVSTGPPKVKVPTVKGQQWAQAQQALVNAHLKPVEHVVPGNTKGQVTATDPPAGQSVPKGSTVRVNVMSGPELGTVPNVVGDTVQQATSALQVAGFNYHLTYVKNDAPQGQVIHQNPAPSSSEPKGKTVTLEVSNGPPQVSVPSVVGETAQQAVGDLESQGFQVNQQFVSVADPSEDGIVQAQNPNGGTTATQGTTVTIEIGQHSPGPPAPGTTTTTTTPSG